MQLFYCNSQKKFRKKFSKSTFAVHFSAFQDFQNQILFQYSELSYNIKVNFGELSDILRFIFFNIFFVNLLSDGLLVTLGIDGLLIESHPNPKVAKSDASQQLNFKEFEEMFSSLVPICKAVNRNLI